MPKRGLVGDAPWGVVDGWRRKKPEFWTTKKVHSPVKVKEGPLPLPAAGEPIVVPVENQYDFTDLSELAIQWDLGSEQGVTRAALPPHAAGQFAIRTSRPPQAGERLRLEFVDASGRTVDAYRLPLGTTQPPQPLFRPPPSGPLRVREENLLAGRATRVVGSGFELAFDQSTGRLRRGVSFGEALLLDWPELHLVPGGAPFSPLPAVASWRLRDLRVKPDGQNVRVEIVGSYDHFEGQYHLVVTPTGELTVHASFKYSGEKLVVRELGLAFPAPRECDQLGWERRGEWSVYPTDDIGRLAGQTRAFAVHSDHLPPTWPWAEDNSPLGCNDFRSTKRHIYWASIGYPAGPGVWVKSDGNQHVRATVEADRISLCVNDWYGGTHSRFEWTSNYGEGRSISPAELLECTVRLQLAQAATARQAGE
jgi:hypothetical protein